MRIATVIETHALWQTIWTAAVAGIGVITVFSFAVLGAARSQDMQREGRGGAAVAYGVLALAGVLVTLAAIAAGIVLIAAK